MRRLFAWWARLRARLDSSRRPKNTSTDGDPKILVVVEGPNDIEFLRRISTILHADDPQIPDLAEMERRRELIFVPFGGDLRLWTFRLAGLGPAEWHLYDRDMPPETESRQRVADIVNLRPRCQAALTKKRHMESYLHAEAIFEASGIEISFSDDDHVAGLIARQCYERGNGQIPWAELPARARKRRRDKIKKWLNTRAVERMTAERLAERDPEGEVRSWLTTIARLADGPR